MGCSGYSSKQRLPIHRLQEKRRCAAFYQALMVPRRIAAGYDDNRNPQVGVRQLAFNLKAVRFRHVQVKDDTVGRVISQ